MQQHPVVQTGGAQNISIIDLGNSNLYQIFFGLANCRAFLFVMQMVKVYFCRFVKTIK